MRDDWKRKEIFFGLILVLVVVVYSYAQSKKTDFHKREVQLTENAESTALIRQQAEEILATMSIEQKVYQMFIVTPEALTDSITVTTADEIVRDFLKERPVGGIVYFSQNLTDTEQTEKLLHQMQEYAQEVEGLPLFQCVDEEGGTVARIGNQAGFNVPKIKPMRKIKSEKDAYKAGKTIGIYLRKLGFNLNFAPDADVLTNPKNTVIGNRSFGKDAKQVLRYASAYSDGLHESGIRSTFKHFPGHGATEADTHNDFAYTDKTYKELLQAELIPFAGAKEANIDCVMVSHIAVPNITGDNTPCSLSYKMITEVLRGDLGYDGIVVTDAMNMGAIVGQYASDEAAVAAVGAGVDIILMPADFKRAVEGVLAAVESGAIPLECIDESVRRILIAKLK